MNTEIGIVCTKTKKIINWKIKYLHWFLFLTYRRFVLMFIKHFSFSFISEHHYMYEIGNTVKVINASEVDFLIEQIVKAVKKHQYTKFCVSQTCLKYFLNCLPIQQKERFFSKLVCTMEWVSYSLKTIGLYLNFIYRSHCFIKKIREWIINLVYLDSLTREEN